ncbi:MAG: hypothetical protein QOE01_1828 [Actinomycetota bacterium]|jgi:L,D-peptidoglycan transpeptidase YkuD (ErfK/YbiS/YcfS/YnhG family)|nr:hypothetical protein [Actinomycetota bacterium]
MDRRHRRFRQWLAALAIGLAAAAGGAAVAVTPANATVPPYFPTRLSHLGPARQVVVVTASSWTTSYGTLRSYRQDSGGTWHARFPAMRARIGYHGFVRADNRVQNSGKTPAATFRLPRAFGAAPDPGTVLPYRQFDDNDWWPYDPQHPRTYNVYQYRRTADALWRPSWAEHLASFPTQYRYAVVIAFNLPRGLYSSGGQHFARHPADTRRGGGIFLHVNGTGATAGCVSVSRDHMREILRWLDPQRRPRIVMGPMSVITEM